MKHRFQQGLRLPALAVEVGYHREGSFEEIQQQARLWNNVGCAIAIGLNLRSNCGHCYGSMLTTCVYRKGKQRRSHRVWSWFTTLFTWYASFTSALSTVLQHARPLPQFPTGSFISLDLYFLRQGIVDQLMK